MHRQGDLTAERVTIEAELSELHHRKSALKTERTATIDLTNARARARDVATAINRERVQRRTFTWDNQNVAVAAVLLDTLLAPSANGVDKVYHQLKDIFSIAIAQQVESSL
jgi:hypothetical protein